VETDMQKPNTVSEWTSRVSELLVYQVARLHIAVTIYQFSCYLHLSTCTHSHTHTTLY